MSAHLHHQWRNYLVWYSILGRALSIQQVRDLNHRPKTLTPEELRACEADLRALRSEMA